MLKAFYISTLISAYITHTIVTTNTKDIYIHISPLINMLHAAYICTISLPDDGRRVTAENVEEHTCAVVGN
jgi:hypothetical protein